MAMGWFFHLFHCLTLIPKQNEKYEEKKWINIAMDGG